MDCGILTRTNAYQGRRVQEAVSTLFVPPLVIVFVQFKARGVWFSMAKRVTSNAEMRETGHQPFGLPPENRLWMPIRSSPCVGVPIVEKLFAVRQSVKTDRATSRSR